MPVVNLEYANIGEKWKDQNGIVWKVYSVNEKNQPPLIFFTRAKQTPSDKLLEKSAFSVEHGWERLSG